MFTLTCRRCGATFEAITHYKLYCSDLCRRKYQDERRKDERAEARELRKLDILRDEWRADFGLCFRSACDKCRYARTEKRAQKKHMVGSLICDACRMA